MSSEYPHIEQGINKFTADVFNRLMDDLKHGEVNWPTLDGLIRDRGGVGGVAVSPAARLCIVGGAFELDSRDVDSATDPPDYYGQWIYEWAEVSLQALLIGNGDNCGGSIDDTKYPAGIEFNGAYTDPLGYTGYGITKSADDWVHYLGAHEDGNQKRYPFVADPNQPARYYDAESNPHPVLDRRMWRMADHTGSDCCGPNPTGCTSPVFASGGAMNIAEASTSLYTQPGSFIFPGVKLKSGCLSTSLKDLEVSPIKRGSLVWMHLVPFYARMSTTEGTPNWEEPYWVNMFTAANAIDACCQPPEGEGAAAGSVSFRSVGDGEITTSANFHYNESTNTLHVPNISTTGTLSNTGLSTDAGLSYISPIHSGGGTNRFNAPAKALFQPFVFHAAVKTEFVTMNGGHSTNLGSLNIAIYNDESGRPGTKVAGSGATLVGATTATTAVSYVVSLPAGAYWIGSCVNSGVVRVSSTSANSCTQYSIPRATADFDTGKGAWETIADTTSLPTAIALTNELQPSGSVVPRIGLEFQSV